MSNPDSSAAPAAADEIGRMRELAETYGMEFLASVPAESLEPELVAALPVAWARANCLLPVRIRGELCVLTCRPEEIHQQEHLAMLVGRDLRPVLAPRTVILQSIEQCYYSQAHSPTDFLRDLDVPSIDARAAAGRSDDLLQVAEEAPVTQLVNLILLEAVKHRASDIHFEPFESRLRVRYRVDGVLYEQASPPKHLEAALVSRLKVMARMDIAEKRLPQDGMARVRVGEREIDIRASTVPVAEGERVVLRLLDRNSTLLPLSDLGMAADMLQTFESLLKHPSGMIIVSGPTGSGKTTSLYAALGRLDATRRNILTIEDPIEYQLPNIGQIQVKPKIGLTFATGLRHILRQDPDIVLVGETRDVETAEIAIRASLTGHLVFTTLHTNDAPGAILRLVDMGIEPYLLAACLRAVMSQRLVRRLCATCRQPARVTPQEAQACGTLAPRIEGQTAWAPRGCAACLEGFSGRVGLFELLVLDRDMQELIRAGGARVEGLRDLAESRGMVSVLADGLRKVLDGVTCLSEVIAVAEAATPAGQPLDENLRIPRV